MYFMLNTIWSYFDILIHSMFVPNIIFILKKKIWQKTHFDDQNQQFM